MIPTTDQQLNRVFQALAHPIRRALLETLSRGPDTVVSLAEPFDVSLNAISKHIKTLEAAGLVVRSKEQKYHRLRLEPQAMDEAIDWMSHYSAFWRSNLDSLKERLEGE